MRLFSKQKKGFKANPLDPLTRFTDRKIFNHFF